MTNEYKHNFDELTMGINKNWGVVRNPLIGYKSGRRGHNTDKELDGPQIRGEAEMLAKEFQKLMDWLESPEVVN